MAASASACTCYLLWPLYFYSKKNPAKKVGVEVVINSVMAGCVSITASCNNVNLFSSMIIGLAGCIFYLSFRKLFIRLEIDDPLEASIIHGICGLWGTLAVGFFDNTDGLFFSGSWKQLGIQILGASAIITWIGLNTVLFVVLAKKGNRYRVGEIYEIIGMDILDINDQDLLEKSNKQYLGIQINTKLITKIENRQRE
jgi:Amt family ammonium transporter